MFISIRTATRNHQRNHQRNYPNRINQIVTSPLHLTPQDLTSGPGGQQPRMAFTANLQKVGVPVGDPIKGQGTVVSLGKPSTTAGSVVMTAASCF